MIQVTTIIVGFLLTGVVGNWLIYRWQHRNWINQQRITRAGSGLMELRQLAGDIMRLSDVRNYRARKLARSMGSSPPDEVSRLREEYEQAVTAWNDQWNTLCVGLTFHAGYTPYVKRLEADIQSPFVRCGGLLHYSLRHDPTDPNIKAQIERLLNSASGATFNLTRDLLKILHEKEQIALADPKDELHPESLELATTWQLLKFLFQPPRQS